MKKGRGSSASGVRASPSQGGRCGCWWGVGLISLSPPRSGGQGRWGFAPVAHLLKDRQAARGRWRLGSECFAAAEDVPDRLGQSPGEIDLGDFGATLFADPRFCLLVAIAIDGCGAGVRCCLDERPAQVARALL